ncbi:Lytic transglycosylase, catalytic [Desulforamulus reducens MI-1]|uniref:Lytic transglycosylase, catalytic n=1 Tax=Desulforamulus reducens (strain ATCC BAA-1160 / DSM 100696 / MI-1) TaxID=349161 RepID=A4J7G8_DESRM|nr:lytic transglycosylase domain-containing protein [Desulforamulus reducens]ABO51021.1 Lytic transglycosylase, catalytic [Desulforamulus reducens MI-1]
MDASLVAQLIRLQALEIGINGTQENKSEQSAEFSLMLAKLIAAKAGVRGNTLPLNPGVNLAEVPFLPSKQARASAAAAAASFRAAVGPVREYEAMVEKSALRHGIDPALCKAVARAESDFNPRVTSRTGAMGLMQLMPGTARDLGVKNPYDPEQNADGGVRYLKSMLERFDGDVNKALAAYNAGPGAVERYGGIPPYEETTRYIQKVIRYQQKYTGV